MKYFGSWDNHEDMKNSWSDHEYNSKTQKYEYQVPQEFPTDDEILFASYGGASYEGDASVVFRRDGKLFEAHGSHCSCNGLEGMWSPEETTIAALAAKGKKTGDVYGYHFLSDHDDAAYGAYWALVAQLQEEEVGQPAS